jgi:acyl-CoA thioester hydrolase
MRSHLNATLNRDIGNPIGDLLAFFVFSFFRVIVTDLPIRDISLETQATASGACDSTGIISLTTDDRMMTDIFEFPHTVHDGEIDEQGHVNNVVYVAWMQDAALAHSAALGWTPGRYLQLGAGWVARSHHIDYLRSAVAGDEIVVQTHVAEMKRATSCRKYKVIRRADGELLAKAETHWAFIDYTTGKPTRIPPEIADAFPVTAQKDNVTR